jgi:hypothetical protein
MSYIEIVNEIEKLSEDEKYELYDTLNLRFIGRKNKDFFNDLDESLNEYKNGNYNKGNLQDLIKDLEHE